MVGVAALAVGAACGGSDNGDGGGAGDIPADANPPAAEVSFEQQIHPVLVAKCGACHGAAWGSPNVNTSYQAALLEVETSTPTNSDLYERGNGGGGHAKVFSDAEAALVLQWIQQGAKGPAPTTPQTTVSFSTQVHPILTASCTPCHSGTFASSTAATSFAEAKDSREHGCPGAERAPPEGQRAGGARRRRQAERRRRADDPDVDPGGRDEQLSGHLQACREPPERELGLSILDLARLASRDRGAELAPAKHRALLERRAVALVRRVVAPLPVRPRDLAGEEVDFSETMPGSERPAEQSSRSGAISILPPRAPRRTTPAERVEAALAWLEHARQPPRAGTRARAGPRPCRGGSSRGPESRVRIDAARRARQGRPRPRPALAGR